MTLSTAINTLNNTELMFQTKSSETPAMDFSAVFDKKVLKQTSSIGDIKSSNQEKLDLNDEFSQFLNETIDEANVESSLDLTLAKDLSVNTSCDLNPESEEETESIDEELVLYAQAAETATLFLSPKPESELVSESENLSTNTEFNTAEISDEIIEKESVEEVSKKSENEPEKSDLDDDMLQELNIESIETETESSCDNSSLMNRQTPEEQGIKFMLNQEIGTNNFEVQTPEKAVPTKQAEVTPSKIIDQVSKHLESLQNNSKVSIVLNPEALGKVTIQLVKSPEGLSAQFTTATQEAKNLLMKGLDGLKETLVSHGVGVDNVSVKVSDSQKSDYNADWTDREGSRGGNKGQERQNRQEKEKGLFERTMEGME